MTLFNIEAEVIEGARDTGERLSACVLARSRLDAAILGERMLDSLLPRQRTQYCHAVSIEPVSSAPAAMAVAA